MHDTNRQLAAFTEAKTVAEGRRQQAHVDARTAFDRRVGAEKGAAVEPHRIANEQFDALKLEVSQVEGEPGAELWQRYYAARGELNLSGVPVDHREAHDELDAAVRRADRAFHDEVARLGAAPAGRTTCVEARQAAAAGSEARARPTARAEILA
jgi:hypothetical protein